jgi:hypothetical protein
MSLTISSFLLPMYAGNRHIRKTRWQRLSPDQNSFTPFGAGYGLRGARQLVRIVSAAFSEGSGVSARIRWPSALMSYE